jgi:hypothetical protein
MGRDPRKVVFVDGWVVADARRSAFPIPIPPDLLERLARLAASYVAPCTRASKRKARAA